MKNTGRKRRRQLAIYAMVMTAVSVILLIVAVYGFVTKKGTEEKTASEISSEETGTDSVDGIKARLKDMAESGYSLMQILKVFFPDQLILADDNSIRFFDVSEDLKKHGFDSGDFRRNADGTVDYMKDGEIAGIKGIDISKYNGEVDWEQVAASGVGFTFIRAGIRGYGSGKLVEDDFFDDNVEHASAAGITVGTYFLSQAVDEREAVEEADFVLDCIKDKKITGPVAYDLEKIENASETPRTAELTREQHTKNTIAFCERIREAGYTPVIYGNIKTFLLMLDMNELEDYDKWYAGYVSEDTYTPYFPYDMKFWQYSESGRVPGVEGDCDLDIMFN